MRLGSISLQLLFVAVFAVFVAAAEAQPRLKLATTTSTDDSGLLDILLPPFEEKGAGGIRVDVIAV
ncbi:MAG: tungsten ABC transporter substrate-binding protein, partial [Gemmatimonadetes bacterium]|nr:tungsten ABC transporter substrate-binding protein [Gemmatimonadota bacterium]